MKLLLKRFFAINASLAYLGMLTGFGMFFFTMSFFYLMVNDTGLPVLLHALLIYLTLVLGPGALLLATAFYRKMHRHSVQLVGLSKLLCVLITLFVGSIAYSFPPLQLYIELTPVGGTLKPPPGKYSGPIIIKKSITIDGGGKVELDGGGDDTVITIKADKSIVRGLHITHSGTSHDSVDAGITIEADDCIVENNKLDNVLFGIQLKKANNNIVRNNTISSLVRDISIRGDGIRMWYAQGNHIENNTMDTVRDFASNNSPDNFIIGNTIRNSRIGMEFIYSPGNEVAHNSITNNITGIVLIYSNELNIHHNRISHMRKLTGAGLSFKESAEVIVADNEIAHCAVGLQANSPLNPDNRMIAERNLFTYNVLGMYFYGEKGGHIIRDNSFENNFTDVLGSGSMTVRDNVWSGNYWDNYQGFDRNNDGIGDDPHRVFLYSERLWANNPKLKFFRGSPVMEMLDISLRLAPFNEPKVQYSDPTPQINP